MNVIDLLEELNIHIYNLLMKALEVDLKITTLNIFQLYFKS